MGFISKIMKQEKEHGFVHVLFCIQVAWMATLNVSKKEYFIKMILILLLSPIFFLAGYGEFAEKLKSVGLIDHKNIIANFIAANCLFIHYAGKIFPYLVLLNICCFFSAQMWSKEFWIEVENMKTVKSQE